MTDSDTAVDEDTASMLSESEFEREVCTQEDLRTASLASLSTAQHHSLTHSHAHSHTTHTSSSHRRPVAPYSTISEGSASSSSSDSSEASEGVISPMFHNRILLLVPLLYLALTRTLWWPLQASAQVLLVFVLLTLAVRLTSTSTSTSSSSPPQMFHMTPSEIGLKDILEQSKTLLHVHVTQESEGKEHSPVRLMCDRY